MKYFNPTEEVLDIQLTPHGKTLFSLGKFKPKYYSFSDEDIIYDLESAGTSLDEEQNLIDGRIINETPYPKSITRNISVIANDETMYSPVTNQDLEIQQYKMSEIKRQTLDLYLGSERTKINSLGSMRYDTQETPSFKLYMIAGDEIRSIDNVLSYVSSYDEYDRKGHPDIRVPQINIDYILKSTVVNSEVPEKILNTNSRNANTTDFSPLGADNSRVVVSIKNLYFLLEETNTNFMHENFEMEVYEIKEEVDKDIASNVLKKLVFMKNYDDLRVSNNKLLSQQEFREKNDNLFNFRTNINAENKTEFVDYFLDISTDAYGEISESTLCNFLSEIKSRGFGKDISFDCPDTSYVDTGVYDFYTSDLDPKDKC